MASEMRDLDEDVSSLSRTLAVRTLQLEMEYIYGCLEDEALDVAQDLKGAGYLLLRSCSIRTCLHVLSTLVHACSYSCVPVYFVDACSCLFMLCPGKLCGRVC